MQDIISRSRYRCLCCIASPLLPRCTSSLQRPGDKSIMNCRRWFWTKKLQFWNLYPDTVVVFWVVDENSAFGFHEAGLEVVHHPEPVVEEALVVEVEVVEQGLPVVDPLVRVARVTLAVCPRICKSVMKTIFSTQLTRYDNKNDWFFLIIDIPIALPGILVVDQPWISGIGGGSIPGTKTQFIVNPCF